MNEWFAPQLEDYQDPNEEIIWKRPSYDPWIDEIVPPVPVILFPVNNPTSTSSLV